jgi:hypothetical protein
MPTMDYSGEVEFICECKKCGAELSGEMGGSYRGAIICTVELCQGCVDEAVDKALDALQEE